MVWGRSGHVMQGERQSEGTSSRFAEPTRPMRRSAAERYREEWAPPLASPLHFEATHEPATDSEASAMDEEEPRVPDDDPVFRRLSVSEFEEQFLTNNPNVFSTTTSAPPAPLTQEALVDFGGTEQGPRPATPAGQLVRVPSDEESGDNETNTTRNQDEDAGVQAVVTRSQTAVREMQDISNRFAYIGEYMDSHFRLQNVLAAYHEMEALNPEQLAETSAIEVIEQLRGAAPAPEPKIAARRLEHMQALMDDLQEMTEQGKLGEGKFTEMSNRLMKLK